MNAAGRRSSSLAKKEKGEALGVRTAKERVRAPFCSCSSFLEAMTGKLLAQRNFKGQPSMRSPDALVLCGIRRPRHAGVGHLQAGVGEQR